MTAPTVAVTIDLSTMTGEAAASVTVTARMDRNDAYSDGFVLAETVTGTTNASGVVALDLFPNDPDAGLGTQGSCYLFSARVNGTAWHYRAQIPNSACNLQDLTNLDAATQSTTPAADVRATKLTGLSTASAANVAASDSVLSAFGKLQAKHTALAAADGADLIGVQLTAVNAAARTALDVAGDLVFVTSFDNGDDTSDSTRIQRAVEHIRASVSTVNSRDRSVSLVLPPGLYTVGTQIDMTALRSYGVSVLGHGATLHGKCTGKPVIDALYTRWITFVGLTIIGDATDTPKYGVQIGVKDGVNESGGLLFDAVTIVGTFSGAALYNRGSEATNFRHCRFWNDSSSASAYCVIMDGNNAFASASDFVTVTAAANTNASFLGNKFIGCDLRRQTTGSPIVYSGAPGQHEWIGCYAVSYDDYIVEFYRVSGVAHMLLDIHCETSACLGFLLVDNVNPSATVFLQGLKLRDNNHQGSTAIIDTTGTTRQVICDGIEIEIAAPVSGVPLVGSTSGASSKVLLSGEIRWQTTNTLNLSNCRFAGKIYTETSTTITHTIGSYEIIRRPNSADSRVVEFKGETRFSGTTLGTDASNYVAANGCGAAGGIVEVFAGGADTDLDLRLTPKGAGLVRFGAATASVGTASTHKVAVKTASGTTLYLLATNVP